MDSVVYLSDFRLTSKTKFLGSLRKYTNYKKLLIIENECKNICEIRQEGHFDEIYIIESIFNYKECTELFEKLFENETIKFILAPGENVIGLAGYLRSKFGISGGMQQNQAEAVRNKWIMKEMVRQRGIKTCQSAIAYHAIDFKRFVERVGFPIIVKPLDGFASINTFKISDNRELSQYMDSFMSKVCPVLLEEYIVGTEFHCDSIVFGGQVVFSSVGEYLYNCLDIARNQKPPSSITYPKQCDDMEHIYNIKKVNRQVIEALGIVNSVCHAELFLTKGGDVYFGEIGARIGGAEVMPPCIKNSYGIDLFDACIALELGEFNINEIKKNGSYTGMICLPSIGGTIRSISREEEFSHIEGLLEINIYAKVGQQTKDVNDTMTRSGYAIVEDHDYERLRKKLLDVYYNFKIEVE